MVSLNGSLDPQARGFTVPVPEEDGTWTPAPSFPPVGFKSTNFEPLYEQNDVDQTDGRLSGSPLDALSRDELLARCARAEAACTMYEAASRGLLDALALSPSANAFYARNARAILAGALTALPSVAAVGHVECSMPSIASGAEGPAMRVVRYDGLQYSEWDLDWRPSSWWLSVAVVTLLSLKVHVHVTDIRIAGRVRCALPRDLSSVRIAFIDAPCIDVEIQTSIELGSVPVPLHASIDFEIRQQVQIFIEDNLLNDNSILIVLRRLRGTQLDESDFAAALEAAQRASNITGPL